MNKKICVFIEGHFKGGAEKMLLWLSKSMKEAGYDIQCCQIFNRVEMPYEKVPHDSLDLYFSNNYLLRNLKYFTYGTYKIYKYLRQNNINNVVSFGSNSFYIIGILQFFLKINILVSERGFPPAKRFWFLRKKLFESCNVCVFQTYGASKYFNREIGKNSYVIPNPVKIPERQWKDIEDSNTIVFVGRLDMGQKRCDLLIDAFEIVKNTIPAVKLNIVGSGYEERELKMIVKNRNLDSCITFVGQVNNVIEQLAKANVYVLTSDIEGIPNSLLEAMAFGMPVVSTNCLPGGAAYLIGNNENGLLVPKGDKNELAKALIKLLKSPELRLDYSQKARKAVEKYDEKPIIELWNKAFTDLLNSSPRR